MVDSHTHLHLCAAPAAELVAEAGRAGVEKLLTVGTDGISSRAALASAESFPQVHAAVGRHPNEATGFGDADLAELKALASHSRCAAVGESGLDYYRDSASRLDQQRAFAAHIALAREVDKPLIIHCRAAAEDVLAQLASEADGVSVVVHCFSMPEHLGTCVERGYAISFAGNVTYPSATELARSATLVPDDLLLVETDAPYLPPQDMRGQANRPAFVVHTAAFVARLRNCGLPELGEIIDRNAARVFAW